MKTSSKIQSLIVRHLMKHGSIQIRLPDGVLVEIGITQEDIQGKYTIKDDYCWVLASQEDRSVGFDSEYNMAIQFDTCSKLVVLDDNIVQDGATYRRLEVV